MNTFEEDLIELKIFDMSSIRSKENLLGLKNLASEIILESNGRLSDADFKRCLDMLSIRLTHLSD